MGPSRSYDLRRNQPSVFELEVDRQWQVQRPTRGQQDIRSRLSADHLAKLDDRVVLSVEVDVVRFQERVNIRIVIVQHHQQYVPSIERVRRG